MGLTTQDIRWMLVHTTSSLPYLFIAAYLLWVHYRGVYGQPGRPDLAMRLGFGIMLLTVGSFIFNQPPIRFMVSLETNALVKDIVLVLQAGLFTIYADAVFDQASKRSAFLRALLGLVPIWLAWANYAGGTIINSEGDINVPFTVTIYAAAGYFYALFRARHLLRQTMNPQTRWRVWTMIWAFAWAIIYVLGRQVLIYMSLSTVGIVVHINRLSLTLATLLLGLGLAGPEWYNRLGAHIYLLRHAGRHVDNLIGLLGHLTDHTIGSMTEDRGCLVSVALAINERLASGRENARRVMHLASIIPMQPVVIRPNVSGQRLSPTSSISLTQTVTLFSSVYESFVQLSSPQTKAELDRDARVVLAARMYLAGATDAEVTGICGLEVGRALHELIEENDWPRTGREATA